MPAPSSLPVPGLLTATAVAHYQGRTPGSIYVVVITPDGSTCSCPAGRFDNNVCWHVEDLEGRLKAAAVAQPRLTEDPFAPFDRMIERMDGPYAPGPTLEELAETLDRHARQPAPLPFPTRERLAELAKPRPRSKGTPDA